MPWQDNASLSELPFCEPAVATPSRVAQLPLRPGLRLVAPADAPNRSVKLQGVDTTLAKLLLRLLKIEAASPIGPAIAGNVVKACRVLSTERAKQLRGICGVLCLRNRAGPRRCQPVHRVNVPVGV